jgi:hypothetical protein
MAIRGVNSYAIVGRSDAQFDSVSPDDFYLSIAASAGSPNLPPRTLPYCVDLKRERVLFTEHDAAGFDRMRNAAFLFSDQLATATHAYSVPFERLSELPPPPPEPPVFIYSAGRTGSTLLVRVLAAAGLACASEPDILTQIANIEQREFRLLPPDTRATLMHAAVGGLSAALGGGLCIKLRSQSNVRPLLLTEAAPDSRVVFMLRGARAWALSRHRTFAEPPEMVARTLRQAIDAYDKLAFAGVEFAPLWFETLEVDPAAALLACCPGAVVDPASLLAVLERDSQEGTMISREAMAASQTRDDFMAAFFREWPGARVGAHWQENTERVLEEVLSR